MDVVLSGKPHRIERLRERADLVHLDDDAGNRIHVDGPLKERRVRHGQVVADDDDARVGVQAREVRELVLVERVLDVQHGEILDDAAQRRLQFGRGAVRAVERVPVSLRVVEGRGGDIQGDLDAPVEVQVRCRLHEQLEGLAYRVQVRGEAALIADVRVHRAVVLGDAFLQGVHDGRADVHRFRDVLGLRHDLVFLERHAGRRVLAAIDEVHAQVGDAPGWGDALGERLQVFHERHFGRRGRSLGCRHRNAGDRIAAQTGFVRRAVQVEQERIHGALVGSIGPH